jgi:hypothetical protein
VSQAWFLKHQSHDAKNWVLVVDQFGLLMCPELPALLLWKVAKAESPVGRWFIHVYPIYSEFSHEKW